MRTMKQRSAWEGGIFVALVIAALLLATLAVAEVLEQLLEALK